MTSIASFGAESLTTPHVVGGSARERLFLNLLSMGHVRRKPKLLPDKLVLIREHLGIVLVDMARKLEAGSGRVTNYESGKSEPTLMELLVYARSGEVSLELIVDDEVSVDSFRKLLGKLKRK